MDATLIERAAEAVADGELIVYPTETVYGLGANPLDSTAVERVYTAKDRPRPKPVSMAVPSVEAITAYTNPTEREQAFIREFLPGPVTVVLERKPMVPDALTAGEDRVGIRVPAHEGVQTLLDATGPLTATSANVSGTGSVRQLADLSETIRKQAAVVIDGGETPGGGSTVVDISTGEIHRRGAASEAVASWLAEC